MEFESLRGASIVQSSFHDPQGETAVAERVEEKVQQPLKEGRKRYNRLLVSGVVAVTLIVLVAGFLFYRTVSNRIARTGHEVQRAASSRMRTVPLTNLPGAAWDSALSPDGEKIAFIWEDENPIKGDLYLQWWAEKDRSGLRILPMVISAALTGRQTDARAPLDVVMTMVVYDSGEIDEVRQNSLQSSQPPYSALRSRVGAYWRELKRVRLQKRTARFTSQIGRQVHRLVVIIPVSPVVSVDAMKRMLEHEFCDCGSCGLTIVAGRSEVNAAVDASVVELHLSRVKVGERTDYSGRHLGVHDDGAVFAEVVCQNRDRGRGKGGVARRIIRVRRCNN